MEYSFIGCLGTNQDKTPLIYVDLMSSKSGNSLLTRLYNDNSEKTKYKAVAEYFRSQLLQLMKTMNATHPHYIRCIKPNEVKQPLVFEATKSMDQLRSSGLFEVIRIRRELFPYSMMHGEFVQRYKYVLGERYQSSAFKTKETKDQMQEICQHFKTIKDWNNDDIRVCIINIVLLCTCILLLFKVF